MRLRENNISDTNNNNIQNTYEQDEVDKFINSTSRYVNLLKGDGESSIYQFSKDKTKRKLVTKTFTDQPKSHRRELSECNRSKPTRSGREAARYTKKSGA
jgi:hypothetical protein